MVFRREDTEIWRRRRLVILSAQLGSVEACGFDRNEGLVLDGRVGLG